MVYLAKFFSRKKIVALKTISQKEGIPFNFLEKIIAEIEKAGLVKAKRGIQGGYFLTRDPKDITVKEIMRILEKTTELAPCRGCKKARKCLAKNAWKKVENSLNAALDSITLKSLVE